MSHTVLLVKKNEVRTGVIVLTGEGACFSCDQSGFDFQYSIWSWTPPGIIPECKSINRSMDVASKQAKNQKGKRE